MDNENKANILVVDDEEEIRNTLARHFELEGYHVEVAENGKAALEILKKTRIEVVITDIKMPVMDGTELLREIKYHFPMIHTIVITGYVTMGNLLAALRYGADTCVFKPISDMEELEEAVDRAVGDLKRWQKKLRQVKDRNIE